VIGDFMRDTWFNRDLPVLETIVQYFEDNDRPLLSLSTVSEISGIPIQQVGKAAQNLDNGGFIDLQTLMTGADYGPWLIKRVYSEALVATGAWPSPESLSAAVLSEFEKLAQNQSDEGEKGWLKRMMSGAGEISKEVFIRVLTESISKVLSPGR
jgi:hypothetical protein